MNQKIKFAITEKYICKDCGKGTYGSHISSARGEWIECSYCGSENLIHNPDYKQGTPYYKVVGANWNDF